MNDDLDNRKLSQTFNFTMMFKSLKNVLIVQYMIYESFKPQVPEETFVIGFCFCFVTAEGTEVVQ